MRAKGIVLVVLPGSEVDVIKEQLRNRGELCARGGDDGTEKVRKIKVYVLDNKKSLIN